MTDQTPGSEKGKEAQAFNHYTESSVLSWLRSSNEKEQKECQGWSIFSSHPFCCLGLLCMQKHRLL